MVVTILVVSETYTTKVVTTIMFKKQTICVYMID